MFDYEEPPTYTGRSDVDVIFAYIERQSRQDLQRIRNECVSENQRNGRYSDGLRKRLADVRRVVFGKDEYERAMTARPCGFGVKVDMSMGLNMPSESKGLLFKILQDYLNWNNDKDKDSIGMSVWKFLATGSFDASYRRGTGLC